MIEHDTKFIPIAINVVLKFILIVPGNDLFVYTLAELSNILLILLHI